jgi:LuxR family transcriptional regulator, maltose regulon positive regulatory protein
MVTEPLARPPAKLARPRADGLAARPRLFALLDRFRNRPITWIVAAPGAGKTALITSWLSARGLPCVWYHVDAGDADPATVTLYLRQAASPGASLPALSPEYLADLAGFADRFWRAFFAHPGAPAVVVFDSVHEAGEDSPFLLLVKACADALPGGTTLVVASRTPPPPAFARHVAHADLAMLDADDLRFTLDEARALAGGEGIRERDVASLHERSSGWAAGLRMLLEGGARAEDAAARADSPDALLRYFEGEVLERAPAAFQELWLATAYLPRFDAATAAQLSGRPDVGSILEDLSRRRFFIDRVEGAGGTYRYHALFATFLRQEAARRIEPDSRRALALRSAALLAGAGDPGAAFELYCAEGDYAAAIPLALQGAPALLAQGRFLTLALALARLPEQALDASPWLRYWLGVAHALSNPERARGELSRAYDEFVQTDDRTGQALAIAAVMDTYFAEVNFTPPLDPWVAAAERLVASDLPLTGPGELRFWSGLLAALAQRAPAHALGRRAAERVEQLLPGVAHPGERLFTAARLVQWANAVGDSVLARRITAGHEPLSSSPQTTPLARIVWRICEGVMWEGLGDGEGLNRKAREAVAIAREYGVAFLEPVALLFNAWALLGQGRTDEAAAVLREAEPGALRSNPSDVAMFDFLSWWLLRSVGRHAEGMRFAERGVALIESIGGIGPSIFSLSGLAVAKLDAGDAAGALEVVARAKRWSGDLESGFHVMCPAIVEAAALRALGRRDESLEQLRRAFRAGRLAEAGSMGLWLPDIVARACADALEAGIEVNYVHGLIRQRALAPPSPETEHWPWPVRVHALGQFAVLVDGEPVGTGRKAQRRVLDLMKAIISLGPDGVSREAVAAALWPQLDGDAANNALEIALHRLRKLVGHDSIHLSHGMLAVNASAVWIDSVAFERLAHQANAGNGAIHADAAERALGVYRGPFLDNDDEAAWMLPQRERLKSRYVRLAAATAQHCEQTGDHDRAVEIYAVAVDAAPLSEDLYRRLMRALAATGRAAEALDAYRRCRRTLSVVLGVAPSPETEALRATIDAAAAGG